MPSIFSTQNLQTFLRRKNLRPPPPPPGPPGPPPGRAPGRGPRGAPYPPPPPPPSRGAPPSARALGASVVAAPAFLLDSSAMILLLQLCWPGGNARRQVQPSPGRSSVIHQTRRPRVPLRAIVSTR